jgi:signal transduction histidine kinase
MKKNLSYFFATLIFNTAIAGVLKMLIPDTPFWFQFIYSQCIGLSVLSINLLVITFVKGGIGRWAVFSVSLPGSVALGITLASFVTGAGGWSDEQVWQPLVLGLFFGFIGAITVLLWERIHAEVDQRKLVKSESQRREVEANLRLLQAQIEPHFLFNTLANVSSLIDSDPVLARKLLERLNDWLRVALVRSRSDKATLGDEMDMLENYLQILKIRFGERLRWRIEVHEGARRFAFPPMLLQPLVENALRHGIEPKIGGGEIAIRAGIDHAVLRIEVSDNGAGLVGGADGAGAGLANVRARLATLFGEAGRLMLRDNVNGGAIATLELPL